MSEDPKRESDAKAETGRAHAPRPGETARAQAKIEAHLKRVYDETATEALPPKLAALLDRLKAEDRQDDA